MSDTWVTHLVVWEVCSQHFCQHVSAWSPADMHQQHRGKQNHEKYLHLRAKHLHLKLQTPESNSPDSLLNTDDAQRCKSPMNVTTVWARCVELINRPLHLQILLILKPTKGCDWWTRAAAAMAGGGGVWRRLWTEVSLDRKRSSSATTREQNSFNTSDEIWLLCWSVLTLP